MIVLLIITVVLVFAAIAGITIYEKIQTSEAKDAGTQNPGVPTAPLNKENALNPPSIWNAETNGASTNVTTLSPEPAASDINVN